MVTVLAQTVMNVMTTITAMINLMVTVTMAVAMVAMMQVRAITHENSTR